MTNSRKNKMPSWSCICPLKNNKKSSDEKI